MAKSIRDVLAEFREHSLDERDKGARFEQLMKDFLQNDTQYQRLFDEVWLWSEYPDRGNRPDTGIDLVARERDTAELVAIQCKFYAPDALISKPDIDSFLASSSKAEFKGRMFISTSDNWGKNAEEAIAGQKPEVARLGLTDLDESSIDWSKFSFQSPQRLEKKPRKTPRPHQEEAITNVLTGFKEADRGKLIMACGTGKTFTSLKLVERMFPQGGTVLFLVPSISLLSQALKEWTIESEASLRSYAVCSDVSVGKRKNDEDLPITDLALPATTNTERLVEKFTNAGPNQNGLTVIFSTYQSIDVVARAQGAGIPEFDLIICDEAHRTTGVTLSGDDESAFVKVHNQDFIKGKKRLYMTATPKVFSDASSKKAEEAGAVLADMGKPDMFGEEFHRLGFGEAVERGILTDYKVLVLAVDEAYVARRFQRQFADENNELKLEDAAKIVGCWNGLSKRSAEQEEFQIDPGSMKRAVAFARSIAESKKIASMFQSVVDEETAQLNEEGTEYLRCEVEHVDGSFNSLSRNEKLDWLRREVPDNTARILSNARCLTEGVDVPALDAVMFLNPRDSQVDVVQAVGRVMRKLEGKKYGYVILPIGVPADMDPATALNDNKKYKVVWQVLQALRSHDERFDAMVNKIDLTKKAPQIGIIGVGGGLDGNGKDEYGSFTLDFPNFDQWRDAILAKIVQKVGEKRYWENWAKDIADIAGSNIVRIKGLVTGSDTELAGKFSRFVKGLQDNLNPSISENDAIEMLAQHLITRPVFDALFEGYEFSAKNPVSVVMQDMLDALDEQKVDKENQTLEKFYASVRSRLAGIDSAGARQAIVQQLYEEFFRNAFPATSERLGIVYTPNEVVDFMLHSVGYLLKKEFGTKFGDQGVHVLDPFTGTGTFIVRLIQSGLVPKDALNYVFDNSLHANEMVLLAYYVAAVNIEAAWSAASGEDYRPFEGILLTDTFQMHEKEDRLDGLGVFPENNARVESQKELELRVIVGNPPWSMGQKSANDNNPNLKYPSLDARISETYVQQSSSVTRTSVYDSYIRAIRWATDRIGSKGIVAFVSNGSFLDTNSADGLRKCLVDDFDSIYVFNLRGNARTSGEQRRREKDNVFGVGTRTTTAIYFLVKTGTGETGPRSLKYHDIGDYLSRDEKLKLLSKFHSIEQTPWTEVFPNANGDWLSVRDESFQLFLPLGDRNSKGKESESIFKMYTGGLATSRDAWTYNFSRQKLEINMRKTIDFYNSLVSQYSQSSTQDHEQFLVDEPTKLSWVANLIDDLKKKKPAQFDPQSIRLGNYRPFTRQWVYSQRQWIWSPYQTEKVFPVGKENFGIAVTGPGSREFGVLMIGEIPSFDSLEKGQVFPRYFWPSGAASEDGNILGGLEDDGRVDAISDWSLERFREKYGPSVSKDQVFYYVYGVLNSPEYKERFKADLKRGLPRIPLTKHFLEFATAGAALADLHLNYESVEPYDLQVEREPGTSTDVRKMQLIEDKGGATLSIQFNDGIRLSGIPPEVNEFRIGVRSALEWVIDRYRHRVDSSSQILNDPNDWQRESGETQYVLDLVGRIVRLSVESLRIVRSLPTLEE